MPINHDGLNEEISYVSNESEIQHIKGLFDNSDPKMHEIAHKLIIGDQHSVDELTKKALDDGFTANTILDDGLISGMAIVGIKFRDNIIFVPEVLIAARAMKAGMTHWNNHYGYCKRRLTRYRQKPMYHDAQGCWIYCT